METNKSESNRDRMMAMDDSRRDALGSQFYEEVEGMKPDERERHLRTSMKLYEKYFLDPREGILYKNF